MWMTAILLFKRRQTVACEKDIYQMGGEMRRCWIEKLHKDTVNWRWARWIICYLFFCLGSVGFIKSVYAEVIPLSEDTLQRRYDAVIIKGEYLGPIQGMPISSLRLFSYKQGQFHVIPFQVDERDPSGEYVLPSGPQVIEDVDKGVLDYNDELVLMARDAGDRAPNGPGESFNTDKWIELELLDPIDFTQKAWVYVCHFSEDPPALSSVDYVNYIPEKEQIFSENYGLGYGKGMVLYTDLFYPDGNGGFGPDLLDRVKVRIKVKFLFNIIRISKSEDDFRAEVVSWKDGPVRVLRNVQNYVRILYNLSSPSVFSVSEYYSNYMFTPLQITIPFDLKWVFNKFGISDFTWNIYADLPGLEGGTICTNKNMQGFPLSDDHSMDWYDWKKKNIDTRNLAWGGLIKPNTGTWICNLVIPDNLYQFTQLYLNLDKSGDYAPEDIPGEVAGGAFINWKDNKENLFEFFQPGIYEVAQETYFPPSEFSPNGVQEWRNIREFPIQVKLTQSQPEYTVASVPEDITKIDPVLSKQGTPIILTDIHGKRFILYDVKYHIGTIRATMFDFTSGQDINTKKWHSILLSDIKCAKLRIEEEDPITELKRPLVAEITQKNGDVVNLITCKCCTISGNRADGKRAGYLLTELKEMEFIP